MMDRRAVLATAGAALTVPAFARAAESDPWSKAAAIVARIRPPRFADRRFSIGLYGQNITDEVYKTEGQEFSSIGSIRTAYYGAPATYYVRGTFRF